MKTITKNATQHIRVERTEYQGHHLISFRVWFKAGSGQMRPGKGGFTIRAELAPELVSAIESEMGFAPRRQGELQIDGGVE